MSDNNSNDEIELCSESGGILKDWNEDETTKTVPRAPSPLLRPGKRPTPEDPDENIDSDGFQLVKGKRRTKKLNRSLSQNNINESMNRENMEPIDTACETYEVCLTSKEALPKQVGLAKLLRSEGLQNIQKISYKSPVKVLIKFNNKKDAEKLLKSSKLNDSDQYRCHLSSELSLTYGIIRQIEFDVTEDEIKNTFECMYKIVSAKRLKRLDEHGVWVDSETVRVCFQSSTLPPYVYAYGYGIKVELNYFPVTQCSGCWKFGHFIRMCPTKKKICPKCGDAHANCETTSYKCVNCKGDHMALNKSCPVYLKEKQIRTTMTNENCTYRKALQNILTQKEKASNTNPLRREEVFGHEPAPQTSRLSSRYRDALLNPGPSHKPDSEMEQDFSESEGDGSNCNNGDILKKPKKAKKNKRTQQSTREPVNEVDLRGDQETNSATQKDTTSQQERSNIKDRLSWTLILKKAKEIMMSELSVGEKIKLGLKLIIESITKYMLHVFKNGDLLSSIFLGYCNG